MTNTTDLLPLAALTAHLEARSRGAEVPAIMASFAAAGVPRCAGTTPIAVAHSCHQPGRRRQSEQTIGRLVDLAADVDLAGLTVLVALRPALVRIAHHHSIGIPVADAEADVVANAWIALADHAGTTPGPAAARRIVAATRDGCRNDQRRHQRRPRPVACHLEDVDPQSDPADQLESLLDDARLAGIVTASEAALMWDTRVAGYSVAEIAACRGQHPATVRTQRSRAEQRLRVHTAWENRH